jgi:hypothetical protein
MMRNKKNTMRSKNRNMKNPKRKNLNQNLLPHKRNDLNLTSIVILAGTMDLLTEACDKEQ